MRFPIPIVVFATLAAALPQVDDLKSLESSLAKTLTRGKPLPSPAVNGPKADAEKELPRLQTTKAKKTTKIPIEIPIPTVTMPKGGPEKLAPSISTGKVPPAVATSKPAKGKGKGDLNGEIASLEAEVAKLINGPAYASLESYASKKGTDGAKTWDLTPTSKLTKSKPTGESSSKDPSTLKKTTRKDDKAEETKTKSKEERQDKQMATFEQYGRSAVSAMSEKQQKPTLAPREDKSWATLCEPFEASDDTPDVPTSHLVERDETDDEMAIAKAAGLKCYASCKHWYRVAFAKYFVQIINCNQHEVYNRVIKAVKPFCAVTGNQYETEDKGLTHNITFQCPIMTRDRVSKAVWKAGFPNSGCGGEKRTWVP